MFFCRAYLRQAFATKACNNRPPQRGKDGGGDPRQNRVLIHSHMNNGNNRNTSKGDNSNYRSNGTHLIMMVIYIYIYVYIYC